MAMLKFDPWRVVWSWAWKVYLGEVFLAVKHMLNDPPGIQVFRFSQLASLKHAMEVVKGAAHIALDIFIHLEQERMKGYFILSALFL